MAILKQPALEDMCGCENTKPLRNWLSKINQLYSNFNSLRLKPVPIRDYYNTIDKIKFEILEECLGYEKFAQGYLEIGIQLSVNKGRVCCSKCNTEIALPDTKIIEDVYPELNQDLKEIAVLS